MLWKHPTFLMGIFELSSKWREVIVYFVVHVSYNYIYIYIYTLSWIFYVLVAIGITNQRETTVAWDRVTGLPLYNAVGLYTFSYFIIIFDLLNLQINMLYLFIELWHRSYLRQLVHISVKIKLTSSQLTAG